MCKYYSILATIVIIAFGFYTYKIWQDAEEKIAAAEKDLHDYKSHYNLTIAKGDSLEAIVLKLEQKGELFKNKIDSLEIVVEDLKTENAKMIEEVADLFQPDELVDEVKNTFPELRNAPIGIARVKHPETGFKIRTFQFPLQFVATFIADHKELELAKKQIGALAEINFTYKDYVSLQDSIITLKKKKQKNIKREWSTVLINMNP